MMMMSNKLHDHDDDYYLCVLRCKHQKLWFMTLLRTA